MKFIGRREELHALKKELSKNSRTLVSLIGRCGVGKTALIDHFKKS